MISARALGVYVFLLGNSKSISAEVLAKEFKEGRNAMLTALKELRDKGLIKTHRYSINGRFATSTEVVNQSLIPKETLEKLRKITSSQTKKINPQKQLRNRGILQSNNEQDKFIAGNHISTADYISNSNAIYDEKLHDYDENRSATVEKQNLIRHKIPTRSWKPKHVCQEFSNRIWTMDIKPWNLNASNFIKAMGAMRKKYNTDGEIEVAVMDAFFVFTDIGKYSEPERLWRLFLKRFPSLLPNARENIIMRRISAEDKNRPEDKFWTDRGL